MHDESIPTIPHNQSRLDRAVRIGLGLGLLALGLSGVFAEPLAGIIRIVSLLPLATGLLAWCPTYEIVGALRTARGRERDRSASPETARRRSDSAAAASGPATASQKV